MFKTIEIGSCVQIQGLLVRSLPDGRITISVGEREFTGLPIPSFRAR